MNINSKLSVYTAQAGAEVQVDKADREEKYRDSFTGKAMYYGNAAISGATLGIEVGKTMQPMMDNMKVRRQARREYNANEPGDYGGTTDKGTPYDEKPQDLKDVNNFRDYYKKTVKEPAKAAMEDVGPMETIYDESGEVLIEGRDRTSNRMGDKARVKALYLNSVTNYQDTGATDADGTAEVKQTTVSRNAQEFYPKLNTQNIGLFKGDGRGLISYMNTFSESDMEEDEEYTGPIGEAFTIQSGQGLG